MITWNDMGRIHILRTIDMESQRCVSEGEDINLAIISLMLEQRENEEIIVRNLPSGECITYEAKITKPLFGKVKLDIKELMRDSSAVKNN